MPVAARLTLASCAVAVGLVLVGCGGSSEGSRPPGSPHAHATIRSGVNTMHGPPTAGRAQRSPAAAGERCQADIGGFLASMEALRKRLAVGVTYDQYLDEIHAVRSTYRKIPVQALPIDCLTAVGAPGEHAFNRYIEAADAWGECVSQAGCEAAQVEPALQRKWRLAAHFLDEAGAGLRRVD